MKKFLVVVFGLFLAIGVFLAGGFDMSEVKALATPSITVVSPNGGEQWEVGSTHAIKWSSSSISSDKRVSLFYLKSPYDPLVSDQKVFIASTFNDGVYNWIIPSTLSLGEYKIYITYGGDVVGYVSVPIISDISDAPFSIVAVAPATPIISFINPSSGPIGTEVVILGRNFMEGQNTVKFGPGYIHNLVSRYGKELKFTVPNAVSPCLQNEVCTQNLINITPGAHNLSVITEVGESNSVKFIVTEEIAPSDFLTFEMNVKWGNVFGKVTDRTKTKFDGSISLSNSTTTNSTATSTSINEGSVILLKTKKFEDNDKVISRSNPVSWTSWIYRHWDGVRVKVFAHKDTKIVIEIPGQGTIIKSAQELYDLETAIIKDVGSDREIVISETPKAQCFPDGTIIKLPDDPKVYVIIDCRKYWIETAEEFKRRGYEWENIEEISSPVLRAYADYLQITDNLLRAIGHNKVYIVKNGKRLWVPTISAFNAQGLKWSDIQDAAESDVNQYPEANLVKAEGDQKVYLITKSGKKKHILNPKVFNSYNNKWLDILEITPTELNAFPDAVLIRAKNDFRVYKIANGKKQWIKTSQAFNRLGYSWNDVVEVNDIEFNEHGTEAPIE